MACTSNRNRSDRPCPSPSRIPESGECNAASFVLSPAETEALWPADERWHLTGFTVVCADAGRLTFDIVEPRHGDRSIARVICEVSGTGAFVLGYRMVPRESEAEIGLFEILRTSMRVFLRQRVPEWARPTAIRDLAAGWSKHTWGRYHVESGDARLLQTWSWNGHHTDQRAECKHPNPGGSSLPVVRLGTLVIEDDPKFESLPLDQWPEPVWFVRMRYDAD